MKKLLCIHLLFGFFFTGWGQPIWIKRAGGQATDLSNGIWVDQEKNVFVAGSISDKAKFFKTEVESKGGGDVYVAKYNKDGVLIWVKTFGGKLDDFANAITGDPEGNLYITGVFTDSALFENEVLEAKGPDIFVAKLDPKGRVVWVKRMETAGTSLVQAIAVTEQGGVFLGGLFSGQFNSTEKIQFGQTDGFVAKLSWQGEVSWVKIVGGPGFDEINMLKTDPWGRVVAGGNFDQFLFVEDKVFEGLSSKSAFAIRMESTGNILWIKTFTGKDSQIHISDATTDESGQVYLCGKFSGESKFDMKTLHSKGQTDIFISGIAKNGEIKWVSELGGADVEEAYSIQLTTNLKSILVSGSFNKLVENGRKSISAEFDNQLLVSRWDMRGNLDELRKIEFNSVFQCAGRNLDGDGNLWLSGSFNNKTQFGKTSFVSAGEEDIFISAFSEPKIAR